MNAAGTYFIDHKAGLIFFDGSFANRNEDIVVLDYISDGLDNNADLSKVYMPVSYTHLTLPTNREV